jgi:hypothetical protein
LRHPLKEIQRRPQVLGHDEARYATPIGGPHRRPAQEFLYRLLAWLLKSARNEGFELIFFFSSGKERVQVRLSRQSPDRSMFPFGHVRMGHQQAVRVDMRAVI